MTNKKMSLAPRKWYTLEQASLALSDEFNRNVTVEDLIHYLFNGAFLPYLHIKYEINNYISFNSKYRIEIDNISNRFLEDTASTIELDLKDVDVLSNYCSLAIQGIDYPHTNTTKWLIPFVENLLDKMQSEFGELTDESDHIIYDFFKKYQKLTFGIDGLMVVKIDCLYNGTPSMSEEFDFIHNGIRIKEQDFLTPPIIDLQGKGLFFHLSVEDEFYIPAKELIIVYDDLLRVKHNFRANIKGFAEYADENGNLPPEIPGYFIEWEHKDDTEQKTIEKTGRRIEKHSHKTPIQYSKEYARSLVIESCIATARDYPTAGKNTLVKAVLREIKKDTTIKGLTLQSERTYTNLLDQRGYSFPDEKGKTIEISKVTIVKP